MMDILIPVKVDRLRFHPDSGSYAVILKAVDSDRIMPVMVGPFEAQSIAMALEGASTERPTTHDLMTKIISDLQYNLVAVQVSDLIEGVFYSRLILENQETKLQANIDARPSDCIAVALRMKSPIFIQRHVMEEAGFIERKRQSTIPGSEEDSKKISLETLQAEMAQAIANENYEKAAILRDKIRALNLS
ncbi:MAG: bifunctional nuclease domain-containing protein [Fidelibacterota bacterium]